jgi:hypothetical protein
MLTELVNGNSEQLACTAAASQDGTHHPARLRLGALVEGGDLRGGEESRCLAA